MRYVVLHHTGIREPHFDLMLELSPGSELSTWRLLHWPPMREDQFTPLPKHRREYLEYEGPVSGDRGEVNRVAAGSYRLIETFPSKLIVALGDDQTLSLPV
jgi:hypothetical protein